MSEPRDVDDMDPDLEAWLAEVRGAERRDGDAPELPDLDGMLAAVEGEIAEAETRRSFWLKTRPTWLRRLVAGGAAAAIVALGGVLTLRPDFGDYPPLPMAIAIGALAALLGLSLHQALRPLHRPPLSGAARGGLVGLTLAATLAIAFFSPHVPVADGGSLFAHVSPCLFYGLLTGVPAYLLLRLLDRRAGLSALLGACAAGLLGNLVLQLHCPRSDLEHLMLAHFGVVVLFVGGLGLVHLAVRALRGVAASRGD